MGRKSDLEVKPVVNEAFVESTKIVEEFPSRCSAIRHNVSWVLFNKTFSQWNDAAALGVRKEGVTWRGRTITDAVVSSLRPIVKATTGCWRIGCWIASRT